MEHVQYNIPAEESAAGFEIPLDGVLRIVKEVGGGSRLDVMVSTGVCGGFTMGVVVSQWVWLFHSGCGCFKMGVVVSQWVWLFHNGCSRIY